MRLFVTDRAFSRRPLRSMLIGVGVLVGIGLAAIGAVIGVALLALGAVVHFALRAVRGMRPAAVVRGAREQNIIEGEYRVVEPRASRHHDAASMPRA
jgi:hypothetical protein